MEKVRPFSASPTPTGDHRGRDRLSRLDGPQESKVWETVSPVLDSVLMEVDHEVGSRPVGTRYDYSETIIC